jgi:hypothetical protein
MYTFVFFKFHSEISIFAVNTGKLLWWKFHCICGLVVISQILPQICLFQLAFSIWLKYFFSSVLRSKIKHWLAPTQWLSPGCRHQYTVCHSNYFQLKIWIQSHAMPNKRYRRKPPTLQTYHYTFPRPKYERITTGDFWVRLFVMWWNLISAIAFVPNWT